MLRDSSCPVLPRTHLRDQASQGSSDGPPHPPPQNDQACAFARHAAAAQPAAVDTFPGASQPPVWTMPGIVSGYVHAGTGAPRVRQPRSSETVVRWALTRGAPTLKTTAQSTSAADQDDELTIVNGPKVLG